MAGESPNTWRLNSWVKKENSGKNLKYFKQVKIKICFFKMYGMQQKQYGGKFRALHIYI